MDLLENCNAAFALALGVPCAVGLANPDIGSKALAVVGVIMLLTPIPAYIQINVSVFSTTGNVGAYCWESVGEAMGKGNDYGEAMGTKQIHNWILRFGLVMGLIFEALLVQFEIRTRPADVSRLGLVNRSNCCHFCFALGRHLYSVLQLVWLLGLFVQYGT